MSRPLVARTEEPMADGAAWDLGSVIGTYSTLSTRAQDVVAKVERTDPSAPPDEDQTRAIDDLATLASEGESQLAIAARRWRDARIAQMDRLIEGLGRSQQLGLSPEAHAVVQAQIDGFLADRADLYRRAAGDFSTMVSPSEVGRLRQLMVDARLETIARKAVARILPLLTTASQLAAKVAVAVAGFE